MTGRISVSLPPEILAELEAALRIGEQHRPSAIIIRVETDQQGRQRVRYQTEGIPPRVLLHDGVE
jgi:hypothetical protein